MAVTRYLPAIAEVLRLVTICLKGPVFREHMNIFGRLLVSRHKQVSFVGLQMTSSELDAASSGYEMTLELPLCSYKHSSSWVLARCSK